MRTNASILILALTASAAFAQTTTAASAKLPVASAKPAAAASVAAVKPSPAAMKPVVKPVPLPAKSAVTEPVSKKPVSVAGRRDPFVSPVQVQSGVGSGCATGKKCLVPGQVQLMGVVKYQDGMIALVENAEKKSYSLRENDPVFKGYVVKITLDSIVFRETTQDRLGKPVSREVVRKLTVPAV